MLCIIPVIFLLLSTRTNAAGISVDAGLSPAEDRWIFRTKLHFMQRGYDSSSMSRSTLNTVLAYGLRNNLTLMLKQPAVHQKLATDELAVTDLADLFFLIKYGIYRRNTREYTFGVATTIGLELPTGADPFTSKTWDFKPGLYLSLRMGSWASDFNAAYVWNGFADENSTGKNLGDKLSLDWAFAYQFSIRDEANISLTPVIELSYMKIYPDIIKGNNVPDSGESVFYLSPGIKFTKSSFILEVLAQIPRWQEQEGSQLKQETGMLIGLRFMF